MPFAELTHQSIIADRERIELCLLESEGGGDMQGCKGDHQR
jgi:hypothetical protein